MGFLSSLTGGDIGKATKNAINKNNGLLTGFQDQGAALIESYGIKSQDQLGAILQGYQPAVDSGNRARSMYDSALGLRGAGGNAEATDAFQAGPGYQFAMDQGSQAALRGASAGGMLNSGNTLTALTEFGQGLANQEYGSWLDRLNGVSGQGLQAVGGQAQAFGGLADLYQNMSDDRLSLESGVTQGRMGLNNDLAQVQEQQAQTKGGFLGGLLKTGLSMGTKALSGGLF